MNNKRKTKLLEAIEDKAKQIDDKSVLKSVKNYKTKLLKQDDQKTNKLNHAKQENQDINGNNAPKGDSSASKPEENHEKNKTELSKPSGEIGRKDDKLLDISTTTKIMIDELSASSEKFLNITEEKIVGYSVDYTFEGDEVNPDKSYFKFTNVIPSYFKQEPIFLDLQITNGYTGKQVNFINNQILPISEASNQVYNGKTLIVYLKFEPHGFDVKELAGLREFDASINPFPLIIMSDVTPQPYHNVTYVGNMIKKLILLYQSSHFILSNLSYTIVANKISNNRASEYFHNVEVMENGEPHILYSTHDFTSELTNNRIYEALRANGQFQIHTGRDHNTIQKANQVIYTFEAYIHTDQYVVAINNLNFAWLSDNRLTRDRYVSILNTFLEHGATIIDDELQVFYSDLAYILEPTHDDYKNYLLSFYLFGHIQTNVINYLIKEIESLELIVPISPIDYMRTNEMGRADNILIRQLFEAIKIVPSTNLVNMIVLEMLRTSYNFKVNGDLNIVGGNIITHLINIFCGACFFPFIFSRLAWYYYPILYTILRKIIPYEFNQFVAAHGFYSRKENNRWVRSDISSYSQDAFDKGILPSIMVIEGRGIIREIQTILKPVYYPTRLEQREEAEIPYVTDDYIYSSSWPIGSINGNANEEQYLVRIEGMKSVLNKLVGKITRGQQNNNQMLSLRSSSSIQTLNSFLGSISDLIDEAAIAFLKLAGPLSRRIMQMPFIPGTIIDLERVLNNGVDITPSSSFIGITVTKRVRGNLEVFKTGFTGKSDTWTFNSMPFMNSTINFCLPTGRGIVVGSISDINLTNIRIRQLDCVRLFKIFRSILLESKQYLEYFFLFLGCINQELNDDLNDLIRRYMPEPLNKSVATAFLKFMDDLITVPLEEILSIYKSIVGTKILNDPRGIDFSIGILNHGLDVLHERINGTRIGDYFDLQDELLRDKISIFVQLLTSRNVPNIQIGTGLVIGLYTANQVVYTDTAPVRVYVNDYIHNETFKLIQANMTRFNDTRHLQLQYTYNINGQVYHVSTPRDIETVHTLRMSTPAIIRVDKYRDFIIEAVYHGKMYVEFTDLKYKWEFQPLISPGMNETLNKPVVESIWKVTNDSNLMPTITFYDSRGLFTVNQLDIINRLERWVLPINEPVDIILASGLFDLNQTNAPYLKRNFYVENNDNAIEEIGEFPYIVNKAHILTENCLFELPNVKVVHGPDLV